MYSYHTYIRTLSTGLVFKIFLNGFSIAFAYPTGPQLLHNWHESISKSVGCAQGQQWLCSRFWGRHGYHSWLSTLYNNRLMDATSRFLTGYSDPPIMQLLQPRESAKILLVPSKPRIVEGLFPEGGCRIICSSAGNGTAHEMVLSDQSLSNSLAGKYQKGYYCP